MLWRPSFLLLASPSENLTLADGLSVLLGVHALLLVFLASDVDHVWTQSCAALHVLDQLLDFSCCDGGFLWSAPKSWNHCA